jgi:predicted DNA-binding transcriptional regulator AlpA
MAHQMLTGTWESTWLPSEETEVLRCLLRTRKKVQTHITRNHAQISLRLSQWYCPLEGRSARLAGVRAVCEDYAAGRSPDVSTLPCFQSAHLVPRRIWALIQQHYDAVDVAEKQLKDLWAAVLETLPGKELFKLNISIRTLWRLVATGQFPQPKRYNRELVRWPTQVFRRWLAQQAADEGE